MNNNSRLSGDHNACPSCKQRFNSVRSFDKHRTGSYTHNLKSRRCLSSVEMLRKGMGVNAGGFWVTAPMSEAKKATFKPHSKPLLEAIPA